jgi:L-threonylcarbamoyladenylate synthase
VSGPAAGPRALVVDPEAPDPVLLAEAARVIGRGGLVAFPTETFYGLGASALDADAVGRVFRAKARPPDKPLLVLVDSVEMAARVAAEVPAAARALIARHWPGPLTLILPARDDVPAALTAGTGTVGVRVPGHAVARGLARAAGVPVTAPSANVHGAPSPRHAREVVEALGARVDLVLDAGPTAGGAPSTVLDVTRRPWRVVRAGAVVLTADDLGAA